MIDGALDVSLPLRPRRGASPSVVATGITLDLAPRGLLTLGVLNARGHRGGDYTSFAMRSSSVTGYSTPEDIEAAITGVQSVKKTVKQLRLQLGQDEAAREAECGVRLAQRCELPEVPLRRLGARRQ